MTWHIPSSIMTAYVDGSVSDSDAWSVEAHLVNCAACRDRVTASAAEPGSAPEVVETVARTRDVVLGAAAAPPGRVRRGTRWRQVVMLSRSASASGLAWMAAAVVVVGIAVGLEAMNATVPSAESEPWPWLAMLGPLVPVAGVAATYSTPWDGAREVAAATPMSGVRLLLWRTLTVLAVIVPLSVVASVVTPYTTSAAWLVPAFALTGITLALTSVIGSLVASVVVAAGWLVAMAAAGVDHRGADAVRDVATASSASLTWLAVGGIAAAVVYLRRASYGSPSVSLPTTSEDPW